LQSEWQCVERGNAFWHNKWVQVREKKTYMRFDLSPIQTPTLYLHEALDHLVLFLVTWFSQLQDFGPVQYVKMLCSRVLRYYCIKCKFWRLNKIKIAIWKCLVSEYHIINAALHLIKTWKLVWKLFETWHVKLQRKCKMYYTCNLIKKLT